VQKQHFSPRKQKTSGQRLTGGWREDAAKEFIGAIESR